MRRGLHKCLPVSKSVYCNITYCTEWRLHTTNKPHLFLFWSHLVIITDWHWAREHLSTPPVTSNTKMIEDFTSSEWFWNTRISSFIQHLRSNSRDKNKFSKVNPESRSYIHFKDSQTNRLLRRVFHPEMFYFKSDELHGAWMQLCHLGSSLLARMTGGKYRYLPSKFTFETVYSQSLVSWLFTPKVNLHKSIVPHNSHTLLVTQKKSRTSTPSAQFCQWFMEMTGDASWVTCRLS